jgi:hypothetical protein
MVVVLVALVVRIDLVGVVVIRMVVARCMELVVIHKEVAVIHMGLEEVVSRMELVEVEIHRGMVVNCKVVVTHKVEFHKAD